MPPGNGNTGGALCSSPRALLRQMLQQKHAARARKGTLPPRLPQAWFRPSANQKSPTKLLSIAKSTTLNPNLTSRRPFVLLLRHKTRGFYHAIYDYSSLETRVSVLFAFASASWPVFVSAQETASAIPQPGRRTHFLQLGFYYWHLVLYFLFFSYIRGTLHRGSVLDGQEKDRRCHYPTVFPFAAWFPPSPRSLRRAACAERARRFCALHDAMYPTLYANRPFGIAFCITTLACRRALFLASVICTYCTCCLLHGIAIYPNSKSCSKKGKKKHSLSPALPLSPSSPFSVFPGGPQCMDSQFPSDGTIAQA